MKVLESEKISKQIVFFTRGNFMYLCFTINIPIGLKINIIASISASQRTSDITNGKVCQGIQNRRYCVNHHNVFDITLTNHFQHQNLFVYTDNTMKIKEFHSVGTTQSCNRKIFKKRQNKYSLTHKYTTFSFWFRTGTSIKVAGSN